MIGWSVCSDPFAARQLAGSIFLLVVRHGRARLVVRGTNPLSRDWCGSTVGG
mgnify:CR=1 FL=1